MKKLFALIAALFIAAQASAGVISTGVPSGTGGGGGVTTFSGDGALISNSASAGAVTATLGNAPANTVWGNNTSGSAAPGYQTSLAISGTAATAAHTVTSASATALAVGANGTTNPAFTVDASTASSATGVKIKSAAAGGGVTLSSTSSNTDENLTIQAPGGASAQLILRGGGGGTVINNNNSVVFSTNAFASNFTTFPNANSTPPRLSFTGNTDTSLAASTETSSIYFNMGQNRIHATGALTLQRDFRITPSTHAFVGASTLTDAAALAIDGAPTGGTNATITNASALYIPTKALANTTNGYGLNVTAPSAATNNYAAKFTGITLADIVSSNTKFTASGCSNSATVGGATAGQFASGTTGTCAVVITMNGATGMTAPNGWACSASDITTGITLAQTASSATTCTISGTTTSGDTIIFQAKGY